MDQEWIVVKVRQAGPAWDNKWMVSTPDCHPGMFETREDACKWLAAYFLRHGNGVPVPESTRLLWDLVDDPDN